ncbi:hypothetical protein PDJAM_G00138100 [Pangasius djambal]|uniref:Uncharacterized protein n=1 Tax=Pangasius djambal TaxID=1691987 RepID=A0ACC5ZE25_9TELE|nr:hypothetical protein [Pangasius djambal]
MWTNELLQEVETLPEVKTPEAGGQGGSDAWLLPAAPVTPPKPPPPPPPPTPPPPPSAHHYTHAHAPHYAALPHCRSDQGGAGSLRLLLRLGVSVLREVARSRGMVVGG